MTAPASPFKGLAYFGDSEHDRLFFFGREREAELVAANLMASRLTVLYGPSGVGKSSLLRAGVAQRLRALVPAAGAAEEGAEVVIVDTWRDDPVAAIAAAAGARDDIPLADALAERALASGGTLYLLLDQMEEYVLYHGRDGGPLATELEEILTRGDTPVHVLLGIRDDSLADLDAFKRRLPSLFGNVLRLDHLTRAAARSAIEGPLGAYAQLGGAAVTAEDALVEAVLDEVATGRIERRLTGRGLVDEGRRERRVEAPYLQLVLERLWEVERDRGSGVLRAETLAELGGAEQIVEEHLERALRGIAADERDLAARLFNHLVTPSGTKIAHAVDDLARYAAVDPQRLEPLLATLEGSRILRRVPGRSGGPPRYEIFHDVLAPAVLAWRDRHESERALADERAAARLRHRRLAIVTVLAAVALALMGVLTVYAFSQRGEAREQATHAQARELVARAVSVLPVDPELSLRLALRSAEHEHTAPLERTLREGLIALRARRVLPGGGGPISALAVTRGKLVLLGTTSGGARVFDRDSGRVVSRVRHGAPVTDVAVAPDGSWFVTGGVDASVRRWETRTGRRLAIIEHGAPVESVAISPDGRLVATAGGKAARVWAAQSARLVRALPHEFVVEGVSFDPHNRALLTIANDVRVFDVRTWKERALLDQPNAQIRVAEFAPTGPFVLVGARDNLAAIWNWRTGRLRHTLRGHDSDVTDVAWSPDGELVATASSDNGARTWWARDGTLASFLGMHTNQVNDIEFSPDGGMVATSSLDGSGRIWSGPPTFALSAALLGHSEPAVRGVAFTPDGSSVVTGSDDGSARVWKTSVDPISRVIATHDSPGRGVAVARRGASTVSAGVDGVVRVSPRDGSRSRSWRTPSGVEDVTLSPDGLLGLTAGVDGTARLWRVGSGGLVRSFVHGAPLRAVAFDRSGRRLATAGSDGLVRIWKTHDGAALGRFRHGGAATGVAFSPDGRRVATAGNDGVGRVWRVGDRRPLGTLVGHENELTSIAYSPNGRQLLTASVDADARLWNASTLRPQRLLRGHAAVVSDAVFSPDGRWIATAGPTTVGLWDNVISRRINAGRPIFYVRGHGPRVRSVAFAADSRRLASTADDGSVRTYVCQLCGTAEELARLAQQRLDRLGANLTPSERRRYLGG